MGTLFKNNRYALVYILISNFFLFFGYRIWETMFNNFAVEEIGIGALDLGLIQAVRELPGLFGFLLGCVALFVSEMRIMALSVTMLGVGLMLTGRSDNMVFLLFSTAVMSILEMVSPHWLSRKKPFPRSPHFVPKFTRAPTPLAGRTQSVGPVSWVKHR